MFEFPFELNLTKILTKTKDEAIYDLISVVVHKGTAISGHYTCLGRPDIQKHPQLWYEYNDNFVTEINESIVKHVGYGNEKDSNLIFTQNAYLLLYEKRK